MSVIMSSRIEEHGCLCAIASSKILFAVSCVVIVVTPFVESLDRRSMCVLTVGCEFVGIVLSQKNNPSPTRGEGLSGGC